MILFYHETLKQRNDGMLLVYHCKKKILGIDCLSHMTFAANTLLFELWRSGIFLERVLEAYVTKTKQVPLKSVQL